MHDRVDLATLHQPVQKHTVTNVADHEIRSTRNSPVEAGGEVVENDNPHAMVQELKDHMAADVAGTAGYENAHTLNPASRSLSDL